MKSDSLHSYFLRPGKIYLLSSRSICVMYTMEGAFLGPPEGLEAFSRYFTEAIEGRFLTQLPREGAIFKVFAQMFSTCLSPLLTLYTKNGIQLLLFNFSQKVFSLKKQKSDIFVCSACGLQNIRKSGNHSESTISQKVK